METIDTVKAFHLLRLSRKKLTRQQYKTFCGQINAGDAAGAMKGLEKLLKRNLERKNGGVSRHENQKNVGNAKQQDVLDRAN